MENKTKLRSQTLDLLRFPLAVVILTVHVINPDGFTIRGVDYSFDTMPGFMTLNYFIDGFLRNQSVPIYFFISGYVFFLGGEFTKETYARKLKNRVKTLLIPYIIWNTAAILIRASVIFVQTSFFTPRLSSLFQNLTAIEPDWSFYAILQCYWNSYKGVFCIPETTMGIYPQNLVLWFIRDLAIVVLCTPIIYYLLKRMRHYAVWILGILWFTIHYWDLGHLLQLTTAFFFFSWGAYLSITNKDMLNYFGRFFTPSMILYPLLGAAYIISIHWCPEISGTIKRLNVVAGLFFAYNIASWLLRNDVCKVSGFLASASFFIYVTHILICPAILKLSFFMIRPTTQLEIIGAYLLTILTTLTAILLTFYLLHKYTPSLLKVLTGRR